jgi:putative ABC transport system ATP-binding protein
MRASVSSDGMVVNGGARRRVGNQTTLDLQVMNHRRTLIINFQLTLFECTTEYNTVLERSRLPHSDILSALRFIGLKENVAVLPQGIKSHIRALGKI